MKLEIVGVGHCYGRDRWALRDLTLTLGPGVLGPLTAMAVRGRPLALAAALAGLGFVVALAVACGVWTGGPRLFQVLYMLIWWSLYAGIGKDVPAWLDLAGVSHHGQEPASTALYVLLTVALLGLAMQRSPLAPRLPAAR